MEDEPLDVVASAILVLMARVPDWDTNIPSMAVNAADAVSAVETWEPISPGERRQQVAHNLLILRHPLRKLRVCNGRLFLLLVILQWQEQRWWLHHRIDVAGHLSTSQRGEHLCFPHLMIVPRKFLGDKQEAERDSSRGCGG